jgi:hypothetical protein
LAGKLNVRLRANFKCNAATGSLYIVDSLGTSFNVLADTVVVASAEDIAVAKTMQSHSIFGCAVANSSSVASDGTFLHVKGGLGTNQEAVTTDDTISGDSGPLVLDNRKGEKVAHVHSRRT